MIKNLEIVAKRVVNDVLRLGEKDSVSVHTYEHMLPLAKEIVKAARRAGADTMLATDSDEIWYDALKNLPESWLKEPSPLWQAVMRTTTARIYLDGPENPTLMRTIPPERWQANEQGAIATFKPFEDTPVPTVGIELALVTKARAKAYGFDFNKWNSSILKAMAVDPKSIQAQGNKISDILRSVRTGRLTAPGGTDFGFEFHGSEAAVFSGEVRPVPGKKATYFSSIPTGLLNIALRQGNGEGKVISNLPIPQAGRSIKGLAWEFEHGKLVQVTAKENLDKFQILWNEEKKAKGADQLGSLAIGLNSAAKFGFLNNWIVEGCATLAIGDNEYLGGTNHCEYEFGISLKGATLEVDGKKVLMNGKIIT